MNRTRLSRQVPRWSELRPLLSFERPGLPDRAHRLQRAAWRIGCHPRDVMHAA